MVVTAFGTSGAENRGGGDKTDMVHMLHACNMLHTTHMRNMCNMCNMRNMCNTRHMCNMRNNTRAEQHAPHVARVRCGA